MKTQDDFNTPAAYLDYVLSHQEEFQDDKASYITTKIGEENLSFSDLRLKKALILALEALEEIGATERRVTNESTLADECQRAWDETRLIADQAALTLNAMGYYTEEMKHG